MKKVPIGVSARHIHLCKEHLYRLFGDEYNLTGFKPLSQPQQFAAAETWDIEGPRGIIKKVRIIGPSRKETQVEMSRTDGFSLGVQAPLRLSGQLQNTPGIRLWGPSGSILLEYGVIVAARHLHMHTKEAADWGLLDKQKVAVRMQGERPLTFEDVFIRVSDFFCSRYASGYG